MDDLVIGLLVGLLVGLVARPLLSAWMWSQVLRGIALEADVPRKILPETRVGQVSFEAPAQDVRASTSGSNGARRRPAR
jgi:hypothetical protein